VSQIRASHIVRRLRSRTDALASERGSFLIETLVGAVLVAVLAVAMLSAFDGADKVSGRTKMRALAASLAQSDQERMRSMPEATLNNLRETKPKYVDGVQYDVASRADWISDPTSTTDCTNNGSAGDYMKITSTVTAPSQPLMAPIVVESVVTPAPGTFSVDQGSLAVNVVDRDGNGISGLSVAINGPASASDVTDSHGCAFFGYEPTGSYTVSTTRTGWVDTQGNTTASKTVSIASQQMSTTTLQYDQAGSATVAFDTVATDPGGATRTVVAPISEGRSIRVAHNLLLPPYWRAFGDTNDHTTIMAIKLFPFTSAYGIYAGDCDNNDPNKQSPAQTVDSVQVNPSASPSLTVREPAVNVHVVKGGVDVANPHVKITAVSPCTGTWDYVAGTDTNANGTLKFPGLPYGTYNVCVDNVAGNRQVTKSNVPNTSRGGTAVLDMDVSGTGSTTGTC
jgi:type II secretory pathway pseudopilin PulG